MDKNNKEKENFKVTGDWKTQSKNLKEKYSQLKDSDLKFEVGKENELIDRLGNKLNKNHEKVLNILKNTHSL